jgi:hypothetical protein
VEIKDFLSGASRGLSSTCIYGEIKSPSRKRDLRENFADSEDTDPRRSHPGVIYIDVNSPPLSIVETFSINQRLCGMI